MPDKPFFAYFAPGATHAPHHVPIEWSDKYKGKFDQGWDALREETFSAPEGARRDSARRRADRASRGDPGLGRHARRSQAGARAPDGGVRRLPGAHRPPRRPAGRRARRSSRCSTTRWSTTSSATTGPPRRARRRAPSTSSIALNGAAGIETTEFMASRIDEFGTAAAYNHYAVGWAHAMDTPYQWTKQVASHWGGTRNGTIVHWPNGFSSRGEMRTQFSHVIDVAATVLDVAGLPHPTLRARRAADAAARAEHGADVRRRGSARAPRDAVLRDVREPRHLPQGLDRGDPPQHPVEADRDAGLRRRRLGAVRARGLDPGPRPRRRAARQAARAAAPVPDRGGPLQRAPARRPTLRALQRRPGRPPAADPREVAAAVRGHGPAVRELRARRQEQVARRDRADRGARGRRRGGDRSRRAAPSAAGASTSTRGGRPTATTSSACSASRSTATSRCRPASTRCGWSSPTTAAASARAET